MTYICSVRIYERKILKLKKRLRCCNSWVNYIFSSIWKRLAYISDYPFRTICQCAFECAHNCSFMERERERERERNGQQSKMESCAPGITSWNLVFCFTLPRKIVPSCLIHCASQFGSSFHFFVCN